MKCQIFVHFSSVVFNFIGRLKKGPFLWFNMGLTVTTHSWKHDHLGQSVKKKKKNTIHFWYTYFEVGLAL